MQNVPTRDIGMCFCMQDKSWRRLASYLSVSISVFSFLMAYNNKKKTIMRETTIYYQ